MVSLKQVIVFEWTRTCKSGISKATLVWFWSLPDLIKRTSLCWHSVRFWRRHRRRRRLRRWCRRRRFWHRLKIAFQSLASQDKTPIDTNNQPFSSLLYITWASSWAIVVEYKYERDFFMAISSRLIWKRETDVRSRSPSRYFSGFPLPVPSSRWSYSKVLISVFGWWQAANTCEQDL